MTRVHYWRQGHGEPSGPLCHTRVIHLNVKQRYLADYRHEPMDRVPVALSYYHPAFSRKHFVDPPAGKAPIEEHIERQARFGFDPHGSVRGTGHFALAIPIVGEEPPNYAQVTDEWRVTERTVQGSGSTLRTETKIETPGGVLSSVRVRTPDDFGTIPEPLINEEKDIELLRYRPDPRYVVNAELIRRSVQAMGDRCWPIAGVEEVGGLASFFRGPERIMYDCYDRPAWVKRIPGVLREYQMEMVRGIARACTDLTVRLNGSFIGFGLSKGMFETFVQEDDADIVRVAKDAGCRTHLHICGKKNAFLENLADMGFDALETLTPNGTRRASLPPPRPLPYAGRALFSGIGAGSQSDEHVAAVSSRAALAITAESWVAPRLPRGSTRDLPAMALLVVTVGHFHYS